MSLEELVKHQAAAKKQANQKIAARSGKRGQGDKGDRKRRGGRRVSEIQDDAGEDGDDGEEKLIVLGTGNGEVPGLEVGSGSRLAQGTEVEARWSVWKGLGAFSEVGDKKCQWGGSW